MNAIRVRHARPEDAAAISSFGLALGEDEDVPGRAFTPEAVLRDAFGPQPRFFALVAEADEQVVGYALATPSYESNWAASGFYVGDIYVAPEARRHGVARKLIAALAAEAARRNLTFLWWTSRPENPGAHAFYASLGATHESARAHALFAAAFERLAAEASSP
jgi:GNAT superfamily N-acetyltransferase